jgi:thiamine biosynthesis lipoprotein
VTIQALGRAPVADRGIEAAFARLEEISRKFNHLDSTSPLYAFNERNEPIADREVVKVLEAAARISRRSGGAFDVTVEPLVRLWGFYSGQYAVPAQPAIDSCLKLVGYENLVIEGGRVTKRNPGTRVDLGGIAKGFGLAEAARALRQAGVDSALIDLGGDVYAMGRKGKLEWRVGIRNPRGEGIIAVAAVSNLAVVTSGDYERFFWGPPRPAEIQNPQPQVQSPESVRYCHIIDPRTGRPARGCASATVLM